MASGWGQDGVCGVLMVLDGVKMASFGSVWDWVGPIWRLWGPDGVGWGQDGVCGVKMASLGAKMASVGSQDGVCGVLMVLDGAKMASVHSVTSDPGCDP